MSELLFWIAVLVVSVFSLDFGIPIHLGVLFMYSRYAFPYFWRQERSSETTPIWNRIMKTAVSSRKTQETHAMPVPPKIKNIPKYIGFLEKQ